MTNGKASPFDDINLQWFADPMPTGQGGEPDPAPESSLGQGDPGADPAPQHFFSWQEPGDDGKEHAFKDADELGNFLKESYFRRSDYTKKTMEHADQRRAFENERASFYEQQKANESRWKQMQEWDQRLKDRPDVEAKLREMLEDDEKNTESLVEKKLRELYGPTLEKFEAEQKEKQLQLEREQHEKAIMEKYPDYDRDAVKEAFNTLSQGDLGTLFEMLHFATVGRQTPEQIQEKLMKSQAKKQNAGLLPGSGVAPQPSKEVSGSIEEARERAKKRYGV